MLPFIHIAGHKFPMYGLMMITGATLAILFACLRAKKKGLQSVDVLLTSIFAFLGGLIGAKLMFVITDIPNIIDHFRHAGFSMAWLLQRIGSAGIVFYGGLIGGFFGGWLCTKLFDLDFWKHADAMIPFLPLAHGFGRIGCFCAGCCYGRVMDSPLSVVYGKESLGAPAGVPILPVQLFEAGFDILLLLPLLLLFSRRERKPGQIVGLYLIVYGIFRFANEYLRDDEIRGVWLGISTSQWISMALIPIGILLMSGALAHRLARIAPQPEAVMCTPEDCASCEYAGECDGVKADESEEDEKINDSDTIDTE